MLHDGLMLELLMIGSMIVTGIKRMMKRNPFDVPSPENSFLEQNGTFESCIES